MKKIPLSSPDITEQEIKSVVDVLRTPRLSLGPELAAFENEFANFVGTQYAIAVSSGTAGLHCVVKALNIGDGDEVITTPFSFIASANCIWFERAKPVFVDIDEKTLCIDADKIESAITPRTKAILPVHLIGETCAMDKIQKIAQKHKLLVIEDACEALGTGFNGKKVGSLGDAGVFAFYPNKQMTTGEGGMIVTNNRELTEVCRSLRNQGRAPGDGFVFDRLGYNYRLSDIQCALGRVQLRRLNDMIKMRRQVAGWYAEELENVSDIILPAGIQSSTISWFIFLIRLSKDYTADDRHEIRKLLSEQGIETAAYFPNIHLQSFYKKTFGYEAGSFPVCESTSERTIALPFYNNLKRDDVRFVTDQLKLALQKVSV